MNAGAIETLLPEVFRRTLHEGGLLAALLEVMARLQQPAEAVLAEVECYFDPYRAPDAMVPVLAAWVDLQRFFPGHLRADAAAAPENALMAGSVGHLRELIAIAIELSQWRGTRRGLLRFLEVATGLRGFRIDEQVADGSGQPIPFHIKVIAPAAAAPQRSLIERILDQEKPVYVTCELAFTT